MKNSGLAESSFVTLSILNPVPVQAVVPAGAERTSKAVREGRGPGALWILKQTPRFCLDSKTELFSRGCSPRCSGITEALLKLFKGVGTGDPPEAQTTRSV